jgi:hypothetical protein
LAGGELAPAGFKESCKTNNEQTANYLFTAPWGFEEIKIARQIPDARQTPSPSTPKSGLR